jgi:hypothetical protein
MNAKQLLSVAICLVTASCTKDSESLSHRSVSDRIEESAGAYLCDQKIVDGIVHYSIKEVWRHHDNLGPVPNMGDAVPTIRDQPSDTDVKYGDEAVIVVFRPPLGLKDGSRLNFIVESVYAGRLSFSGIDIAEVRKRAQAR